MSDVKLFRLTNGSAEELQGHAVKLEKKLQVLVCTPLGSSVKLIGKGLDSGQVYEPILDASQLASLEVSPDQPPFDG
ncbi:MAG: hypothetical protein R6U98_19580, partial [Pirellulaceae bacterium]